MRAFGFPAPLLGIEKPPPAIRPSASLHEKAMENTLLVGGGIVTTLLVILGLLAASGVL